MKSPLKSRSSKPNVSSPAALIVQSLSSSHAKPGERTHDDDAEDGCREPSDTARAEDVGFSSSEAHYALNDGERSTIKSPQAPERDHQPATDPQSQQGRRFCGASSKLCVGAHVQIVALLQLLAKASKTGMTFREATASCRQRWRRMALIVGAPSLGG
jgi:hypothetical protein